MSRLPTGYVEVEYIESTGTQYIDTGFHTSAVPVKYHIVYEHDTVLSVVSFFGARESGPSRDSGWAHITSNGSLAIYVGTSSMPIGKQHVGIVNDLSIEIPSGTACSYSYNGTVGNMTYSGDRSDGIPQYLFAANSSGVARWRSPIKVYSFSITEKGVLVRNFVPCINADGEVGMYDTVTAAFFGNAGSGAFIAGDIVMSQWMIVDRSPADIEAVKILAETIKAGTATEDQVLTYLNDIQKGAYTYRDLNRVEEAVLYVAGQLKELGYLSSLPVIQTWAVNNKPNVDDFARYFGNVRTLRNAVTVWSSTPEAPGDAVGFDYNKANALEQILVDVDQILTQISQAWFYSGDLYSAEV